MDRKLTCREIVTFISIFRIWDAKLGSNLNGLDFIIYNENGDMEYIYALLMDGYYENQWYNGKDWETFETGNIFDLID